jgi:hypothetical protein
MKKLKNMLGIVLCLAAPVSVRAADVDPFVYDAILGGDAGLPDGTIVSADGLDFGLLQAAPLYLNPGSVFASVNEFDIAGVMLGMSFQTVQTLFFKSKTSLYAARKNNSIIYTIVKDWRYNLDYECREQGISAPAELEQCINTLAKKRGLLYPSELHLERKSTGETVSVYFTSNMTDNVVWRVVYKNDVNVVEGAAEKFEDQRTKKILAFWQGVLDKYNAPNSDGDKWISSDNSFDPMMTAYYGSLDLTDTGAYAGDAAKNARAATENFQAKPYAF